MNQSFVIPFGHRNRVGQSHRGVRCGKAALCLSYPYDLPTFEVL